MTSTPTTPLARYQQKLAQDEVLKDLAQARAVELLEDLYQRLVSRPQPTGLATLLSRLRKAWGTWQLK